MYGANDEAFYDIEIKRLEEDVRISTEIQGNIGAHRKTVFSFIPVPTAELECFKKNGKQTFTAIFAASAQQMIGATFVIGYATYFHDLIHVHQFFDASVVLFVVMLLVSAAVFPLSEIFG
jgi:hypothetical protein